MSPALALDPVHFTTLAVMGPLLAALLALRGSPGAIRLGLALGTAASAVAAAGLWMALGPDLPELRNPLGGWGAPLGIELRADGFAVVMLAVSALVGGAVSLYGTAYFGDLSSQAVQDAPAGRGARFFAPLWLLLWTALNGIFLSADLFNLYVMLEVLGLGAAAMVTLAVTSKATAAGMRYLVISLVGSLLFLLGVVLLYLEAGTLSLDALGAHLAGGSGAGWVGGAEGAASGGTPGTGSAPGTLPLVALALMTVGLAAKTALFPLHGWLPPAHAAAPAPGSAILSALVVKGSFYIVVRLWVDVYGLGVLAAPGVLLPGLMGAGAILWGSAMALRQWSLKRLIAYSTVAQLGYLFVMFALLASPESHGGTGGLHPSAWTGGILHALTHATAKAAMFLAAGSMSYAVARDDIRAISGIAHRIPMTFLAFGLGGIALAGIPPSGGFLAKWLLLEAALDRGAWGWVVLLALGGLLTLGYVLRVLGYALDRTDPPEHFRPVPRRMEWTALALALLAVLMGLRAGGIVERLALALPTGGAP